MEMHERENRTGGPAVAATTLILGIGNTLLTDEGAGVWVIERLDREGGLGEGVTLLDGGTLSFTLAGAIEDHQRLIVVDAARLGEEPGTVRVLTDAEMDAHLARGGRSVHEVGLLDLMDITRLAGRMPAPRALIGIEPGAVDWGDAPTPAVATGIGQAAAEVRRLLHTWNSQ